MRTQLLLMLTLMALHTTRAQDAYHTQLLTNLSTEFSLPPNPQRILPNTEVAVLNAAFDYGGQTQNFSVSTQPFTQGRRRTVQQGTDPWLAGHGYPNQQAISTGDRCLVVVWLRSPTPGATVNLFVENSTTYFKEAFGQLRVDSSWSRILLPFQAQNSYAVGTVTLGLHLAYLNQSIEIGGVAWLNYKQTVPFAQLPLFLNNDYYPGIEADAPWRAEADAAIETLRKVNLQVRVLNADNQAVENAEIHIAMQQHDFKFGTAVVSNLFNGGSAQNNIYQEKILNLDGKGHGFNEVVLENDLKWPAWEQHWLSSQPEIASDIAWLKNRGISVRGHNLLWPSWSNLPPDINASQTTGYIKNRINNRLSEILQYPGVGQACIDWDVLNEITELNDLANKFAGTPGYVTGRELYAEVFKSAKALAPGAKLYLNDYVAIERGDQADNRIALWKSRTDEILAAGGPIEGIGFQGHFGATPTGIPRVKAIYDDFWNTFGLEAKVTEYDISNLVPPNIQAQYMRDILTISFAHPSMKGFLMWGFWDGAHWLANAPIYSSDWTLKPSGEAFVDQVFRKWWTSDTLLSNAAGNASLRAFKGKYKVTVRCPNAPTLQNLEFELQNDTVLTVQLACLSATGEPLQEVSLEAYPNPAQEQLQLRWAPAGFGSAPRLLVLDALGKSCVQVHLPDNGGAYTLPIGHLPVGVYQLRLEDTQGHREQIRICRQ